MAENPGSAEEQPTKQGCKKSKHIGLLPPGMAAFPIVDHERNEVIHQPPGLRLIGVLALPSSILATAYEKYETRVRLHNQLHAEASFVVYDCGHQIEARYEQKADEGAPQSVLPRAHAPARQRRCATNKQSFGAARYDGDSTYSQDPQGRGPWRQTIRL